MKQWLILMVGVVIAIFVAGCVQNQVTPTEPTIKEEKKEEFSQKMVDVASTIHGAPPGWCLVKEGKIAEGGDVTRCSWKKTRFTLPYLYKGLMSNVSAEKLRKVIKTLNIKEGFVYLGPSDVNEAVVAIVIGGGGGPFREPTSGMLVILNDSRFIYVITNFDKLYNQYLHYNITPEQKCRVDVSAFYWARETMGKYGAYLGYLGENVDTSMNPFELAKKYSKYGFFYGRSLIDININKKLEKTITINGEKVQVTWIEGSIVPPSS